MSKIIKNLLEQEIEIYDNKCVEWCSSCGEELEIKCTFDQVQKCPECGEYILPCNLCDSEITDCSKCQKIYKEMIEIEKSKESIKTTKLENIVTIYGYEDILNIDREELKSIIKELFDFDNIEEFLNNYTYDDTEEIIRYY